MGRIKNRIFRHRQPIAWGLAVIWAAVIFIFSSIPGSNIPSRLHNWLPFFHFCEYWLLGVLVVGALDMPWRRSWKMAVLALIIASLYGASDEFHQLFVLGRTCDVIDWLVDTAGATIGALAGTWFLTIYRLNCRQRIERSTAEESDETKQDLADNGKAV